MIVLVTIAGADRAIGDADHGAAADPHTAFSDAEELAAGSGLARGVCVYIAVFWGVRVVLQFVFDVREHLTTWWLKLGYHTLTLLFVALTALYSLIAFS